MDDAGGMKRLRRRWVLAVCLVFLSCTSVSLEGLGKGGMPNLVAPTLGGKQLWRDVWWRNGWRVQEHVWTGHARVLDEHDVRRAFGRSDFCVARAESLAPDDSRDGHLVVLLHGLGRSRASLDRLAERLSARGHRVCVLTYPSTRSGIEQHADGVRAVLQQLPGVEHVSFVTHSLGGIVAREVCCGERDWQLGHMVQLAPPNRGSQLAKRLGWLPPVCLLGGSSLVQVMVEPDVGTPDMPIGVIAAAREHPAGYNPLVPGDDDGVVGVEETRLRTPHDHLVVRGVHTFLMNDENVVDQIAHFLVEGEFER